VRTGKCHVRLQLPQTADELWKTLPAKVRNQVRKGRRADLSVVWGSHELLSDFYRVFAFNMRDLGTPVYTKKLFFQILQQFPGQAELCLVRAGTTPIAGALLLHGRGITEVPSASSLRSFNHTCANMLMYWHLLERAIARQQSVFDFGRASRDSNTFRFKRQWGAVPADALWQYYVRNGNPDEMTKDHPRHQKRIRLWQRLPVWLTRLIGPSIVRGIP
jgi:serine/alanine adding enzyme